ncbi:MAG: ImmA/IrrE family metallo-endopeptidase [Negativicoccus succinicivorans]|nr:ImmA/IrrE family metallo-endopeptidase [Negativicoccus succinicivorans]MDU4202645.1 ImmA/IrrE family metallo-endopeptidase [Negativicoccus succinicivorans]
MEIRQKVVELIRRFKTDDPFRIAELKNIHIVYGDLGGKFGNYIKYKRSKFIILDNKKTPEFMLPFVCAHELGHALYTPNENTQWLKTYTMSVNADCIERVANEFAVELLLNDFYISENKEYSIFNLAECRGIPYQFIQLKK